MTLNTPPWGANSCTVLIVLDSLKIHVKLECSSFSKSRDNRGVPNLQFWSRDPEHAPTGANSCAILIVLYSLKVRVKLERSSFSESRDNRGVPNLQFWSQLAFWAFSSFTQNRLVTGRGLIFSDTM